MDEGQRLANALPEKFEYGQNLQAALAEAVEEALGLGPLLAATKVAELYSVNEVVAATEAGFQLRLDVPAAAALFALFAVRVHVASEQRKGFAARLKLKLPVILSRGTRTYDLHMVGSFCHRWLKNNNETRGEAFAELYSEQLGKMLE